MATHCEALSRVPRAHRGSWHDAGRWRAWLRAGHDGAQIDQLARGLLGAAVMVVVRVMELARRRAVRAGASRRRQRAARRQDRGRELHGALRRARLLAERRRGRLVVVVERVALGAAGRAVVLVALVAHDELVGVVLGVVASRAACEPQSRSRQPQTRATTRASTRRVEAAKQQHSIEIDNAGCRSSRFATARRVAPDACTDGLRLTTLARAPSAPPSACSTPSIDARPCTSALLWRPMTDEPPAAPPGDASSPSSPDAPRSSRKLLPVSSSMPWWWWCPCASPPSCAPPSVSIADPPSPAPHHHEQQRRAAKPST